MKRVLVLNGGISSEREIALQTGEAVYNAIKDLGYIVERYDFGNIYDFLDKVKLFKPDVIFNALHGKYGEDGNIQGVLNLLNIPYTHSGVLTSALCMYKPLTKLLVSDAGIDTPDSITCMVSDLYSKTYMEKPFVIKPTDSGSSIDVNIILQDSDLEKCLSQYSNDEIVMVEKYIKGIEITVGVASGKSLAVTEIEPVGLFYDYEAKYTSDKAARHIIPARISEDIYNKALSISEKVYNIVCAHGVIRVDYMFSPIDKKIYFLEVNTQPGMTNMSLVPEQAKYLGMTFNELVDNMITEAMYE